MGLPEITAEELPEKSVELQVAGGPATVVSLVGVRSADRMPPFAGGLGKGGAGNGN